MISDIEIAVLTKLQHRLSADANSDRKREAAALLALMSAHEFLKRPHLAALKDAPINAQKVEDIRVVADRLDSAAQMAKMPLDDAIHKEGLLGAVQAARDTLWSTVGKP